MEALIAYLWDAISTTASHLLILLGPALLLAFLMNGIAGWVGKQGYRALGLKGFLYGVSWLGVAVHELGHVIFCFLFGHKVERVRFFDPSGWDGSLGSVEHRYKRNNIYQEIGNFFIGIGPIILGTLFIYMFALWLIGEEIFQPMKTLQLNNEAFQSFDSLRALLGSILAASLDTLRLLFTAENFTRWEFYLFLYITLSIGGNITLSGSDISGALKGFGFLVGLLFGFNLFTLWVGDFASQAVWQLSGYYSFFYAIMIFAMMLNLLMGLLLTPIVIFRQVSA
jgi:hypothetical protein